jgi:hypothetical protein
MSLFDVQSICNFNKPIYSIAYGLKRMQIELVYEVFDIIKKYPFSPIEFCLWFKSNLANYNYEWQCVQPRLPFLINF